MDLKTLIAQIKNISDYTPELTAYDNQLTDIINDSYYSLWADKRWNFAEKLSTVNFYPDLDYARTNNTTCTVVDGQRLATFSAAIPLFNSHPEIFEGNIFQWEDREYTIVKVISSQQLAVAEPIRSSTGAALTTWKTKVRYYRLPEDCIEIMNLSYRDSPATNGNWSVTGKQRAISPRREEELNLREDYTASEAECYVPVPPTIVPPAEKLSVVWNQHASNSGGGDLPTNTYFELCWAVQAPDGSVGPLSEPLNTLSPAPAQLGNKVSATVSFLTFDDKPFQSKNTVGQYAVVGGMRSLEGQRKVMYYNSNFNPATGERLGRPVWRRILTGYQTNVTSPVSTAVQDDILTADDITATLSLVNYNGLDGGNPRYREWDGVYLRIRPYPRVDSWDAEYDYTVTNTTTAPREKDYLKRSQLRYYFKPLPLAQSTDTPELPYEFHQLIVWKSLEDLFVKNGNTTLSGLYAKKTEKALKKFEARYTTRTDISYQKGQFTSAVGRVAYYDRNSLKTNG